MTFAEEFARAHGNPIEAGGRTVVSILRHPVRSGDQVRIVWRKSIPSPVQGIRLKLQGGSLAIDGVKFADVVLWRDTAPHESVIVCNASRSTGELRVWNCWRDDRGVMQAWVGNSGMVVEERDARALRVLCNCRSEVTFADLVFDMEFEGRSEGEGPDRG